MEQIIPKSLTEEIQIISFGTIKITLKDIMTIAVIVGVFWLMSSAVNGWLTIPYIIFAAVCAVYLILPADKTNPGRRNWETILYFLSKGRATAFSLNYRKEDGYNE